MAEQSGMSNSPPQEDDSGKTDQDVSESGKSPDDGLEQLQDIAKLAVQPLHIDLDNWQAPAPPSGQKSGKTEELLEEIAEDLLTLMQKVKILETSQMALVQHMQELAKANQEQRHQQAYEMDKLRKDLLAERKALATRSTFNAVLPTMDSLTILRSELPGGQAHPAYMMLDVLISSLVTITQTLGFHEYECAPGQVFDPITMECLGQEEGPAHEVKKMVRKGYKYGDQVFRPCGVIIGNSTATTNQEE